MDNEVNSPVPGLTDVAAPGRGCASDVETVKILIGHDAAVSGPPGRNMDLGQPSGVVFGCWPDADLRSGHAPEPINWSHWCRGADTRRRARAHEITDDRARRMGSASAQDSLLGSRTVPE